jgi:hypothetical protein
MTYSYSTILFLSIGFYITNNEAILLFSRATVINDTVQCCVAISISSLETGHVCRNCNILTPRTQFGFFDEHPMDQTKITLPYQNFTNCISQQEEDFLSKSLTFYSPVHRVLTNCQECSHGICFCIENLCACIPNIS